MDSGLSTIPHRLTSHHCGYEAAIWLCLLQSVAILTSLWESDSVVRLFKSEFRRNQTHVAIR